MTDPVKGWLDLQIQRSAVVAWLLLAGAVWAGIAGAVLPSPSCFRGTGLAAPTAGLLVAGWWGINVLAHELAHALVLRCLGGTQVTVRLAWLGGRVAWRGPTWTLSRLPWSLALVLVAGPVANLVLGAAIGSLSLALGAGWTIQVGPAGWAGSAEDGGAGGPASLGLWLAGISAGLGLFNLLPARHLDGARALQALAASLGSERVLAGAKAAIGATDRALRAVPAALGLWLAACGEPVGWLAIAAWWMRAAGRAAMQRWRYGA